jgi:SET domain
MAPLYPHDILVRWALSQGGYFHDDVEVVLTPEKGYHVVVRRNQKLEPHTQVVTCPIPCTMSILNVIDAEGGFTCRGIKIPPAFIEKQPRETVERFFLMEHYLVGKKSWWAAYIATLPTPEEVRNLQFEKPEDIAWVRGTNLANALEEQTEQWKQYYERGMEQLHKLNWQNAKSGKLTWDLFRWASAIFTSRAFTSQVLADTLAADRARPMGRFSRSQTRNFRNGSGDEHSDFEHLTRYFSEGFPVLVPVLDILNYRPLAQVEWQARFSYVGLEILEPVESGEEVCNNYGPRDNETLLLGYSFTVPKNPFDHFSVALRLPPGLSLMEFRTPSPPPTNGGPPYNVVPVKPPNPEMRCYVFKPEHPRAEDAKSLETSLFSVDLLDGISVLRATDREWQAMHNLKKTYFTEGLEKGRFEDSRNLLATMSQLLIECRARLKALQKTDPGTAPRSVKQIFAQIYRESQVDILQVAVCLCEFILRRAMGQGDDSKALQATFAKSGLDAGQIARLDTLCQHHKCMSMHSEMFSFDRMLGGMPPALASSLRYVLSELDKERRLNSCTDMKVDISTYQTAKMQICLTLSASLAENVKGSLTPRYKSWLDQLTQWYPPDDPNWHYVPDRTHTAPEEAPPPLLLDLLDNAEVLLKKGACSAEKAWLQPKMLAWGWNVMEEEGVNVPMDVLDDQQSMDPGELAYLLYFPQLSDRDDTS